MAKREGFSRTPDRQRPSTASLLSASSVRLCICIFFGLFASIAKAVPYGINILANGNAEAGPASETGAPVAVPSWITDGAITVVPYGAPGGFPAASKGPPDGLNQFFAGGNAAFSTATQDIDVSANAVDIDNNDVIAELSGWFGGFNEQADFSECHFLFYDGSGTLLLGPSIGNVVPPERFLTRLLFRSTTVLVPAKTRTIRAVLRMVRAEGIFNDGYADSLSIVLNSVAAARGNNLVHDGGFEASPSPDFSVWWHPENFIVPTFIENNPASAHAGTNSANLRTPFNLTASLSQTLVTIPGMKYVLSYWLAYTVADPINNSFFSAYVDNALVLITVTVPPVGDGVYRYLSTTFTAQGASTVLRLDCRNDAGSWSLDDVSVVPALSRLANISTRLPVETGDNALIAGFIITGTESKKVNIRALGPSLPLGGRLENPTLELRDSTGTLLESNDNWVDSPNKAAIIDSSVPPTNDLESAVVRTLPANGASYTAIVRGVNNGTGIGLVEVYDLGLGQDSKLANISTRGLVQTGDNVLIAGTIVVGDKSQNVIVRAIGPSLSVPGKLANPTLELRDGNGSLLDANDDWMASANKQAIIDSTIPPTNDLESAIVRTLSPANYTAIVRGVNGTTGIAVVEIYALN